MQLACCYYHLVTKSCWLFLTLLIKPVRFLCPWDFPDKNTGVDCHLIQFSSVRSLSHVWLFVTPWITARQASLSITNSLSSLKLTSIELLMPSSHLILCRPLLLLPSIFPRIMVFSNESALHIRWSHSHPLPSGNLHKPFILIHQWADRSSKNYQPTVSRKTTTITET